MGALPIVTIRFMLDIPNYLDFEQVKPLSPLLQVADEFNVQIIVFGGAAALSMDVAFRAGTYDILILYIIRY